MLIGHPPPGGLAYMPCEVTRDTQSFHMEFNSPAENGARAKNQSTFDL